LNTDLNVDRPLFLRVDGVAVHPTAAAVSSLDRGLCYGDGVFRTVRLAGGRVTAWARHARKLDADCLRLGLPMADRGRIERDLADLGALHPECVARITVTSGTSARGYRRPAAVAPATLVVGSALPAWPATFRTQGVAVRVCNLRLGTQPALAGVKHLNRLEQVLARSEWADPAIAEGLTLDQDGNAICGTMTNLFVLEGQRLVTPALHRCGVAGVQRERILDWAAAQSIPTAVEPISVDRLWAADALFLSNSVIPVWWVSRLDTQVFVPPPWISVLGAALDRDD